MLDGLQPYRPTRSEPSFSSAHPPSTYQTPTSPALLTDQRTNSAAVAIAWVATVLTLGYMLPWAIAASRGKSNAAAVGLVNFFVGWTFIGWIAALVMACGAHQIAQRGGGQTVNVMVAQQHFPQAAVANTMLAPAGPPPGWYPAQDGSGAQQFWDGQAWTGTRQA